MFKTFLRKLFALSGEEKILNGACLLTGLATFFPWMGGEWRTGEAVTYSGLGFYTSFLGLAILCISIYILLITVLPLTGGPTLVHKSRKNFIRLAAAIQSTVLILAALSVLTKVTLEFSRMEVRFGILLALVASMVTSLYAFLTVQEEKKQEVRELFHQDEPPPDIPERIL